jgi:hypothetical protein
MATMMETITILLAVVLGLPVLMAVLISGIQWFDAHRKTKKWQEEAFNSFEEPEKSARVLLAWCDARQAQSRLGSARPGDRTCILRERPNFITPEAFSRDPYRFMMGSEPGRGLMPGRSSGFASVHLLLNDGAGHYFRVERKLCLN